MAITGHGAAQCPAQEQSARVESQQFPAFWHSQPGSAGCSPTPCTAPGSCLSLALFCSAPLSLSLPFPALSPSHRPLSLSLDEAEVHPAGFSPNPRGRTGSPHSPEAGTQWGWLDKGQGTHPAPPGWAQSSTRGCRDIPAVPGTQEQLNWIRIHPWRCKLCPSSSSSCSPSHLCPLSLTCVTIPKTILQHKGLSPEICSAQFLFFSPNTPSQPLAGVLPLPGVLGWSEDPPLLFGTSRSPLSHVSLC